MLEELALPSYRGTPSMSSGAMYIGVPTFDVAGETLSSYRDFPLISRDAMR